MEDDDNKTYLLYIGLFLIIVSIYFMAQGMPVAIGITMIVIGLALIGIGAFEGSVSEMAQKAKTSNDSVTMVSNLESSVVINERQKMLKKYSLFHEFPIYEFQNPNTDAFTRYCMFEAFQNSGFSVDSDDHSLKNVNQGKQRFEGIISGNEIAHKIEKKDNQAILIGAVLCLILGMVFMIIQPVIGIIALVIGFILLAVALSGAAKSAPLSAKIIYWGFNEYKIMDISGLVEQLVQSLENVSSDENSSIIGDIARYYQTERTTVTKYSSPIKREIRIAVGIKTSKNVSDDYAMRAFEGLVSNTHEALSIVAQRQAEAITSDRIDAQAIFEWDRLGDLADLDERFPLTKPYPEKRI